MMKNLILTMCFILLANVAAKADTEFFGDVSVGTVVYSYLAPTEFKKLNGEGDWFALNGSNGQIPLTSELCLELKKRDPANKCIMENFGGKFIRVVGGKNAGELGKIQKAGTAKPTGFKAEISTDGGHEHAIKTGAGYDVGQGNSGLISSTRGHAGISYQDKKTISNGAHTHTLNISGWDGETRPENIALYAYLRINSQKSPKHKIKDLSERLKKAEDDLKQLKRRNCPTLNDETKSDVIICYSELIRDFSAEKYLMSNAEMLKVVEVVSDLMCAGIDDDSVQRLFERFWEKHGSTNLICQ